MVLPRHAMMNGGSGTKISENTRGKVRISVAIGLVLLDGVSEG